MNGPLVDDGGSTGDMTPSDKDSQPREHKRKRHTRRLIAVACLCAALILVLVGISIGGRAPLESKLTRDPNVRVGSLTGAGADLDKIVDEGMVSFSINTDPIFSDGKAPGNLTIENLAANNNRFIVTISLKGQGGREVYRSGSIDPGQYIERAPSALTCLKATILPSQSFIPIDFPITLPSAKLLPSLSCTWRDEVWAQRGPMRRKGR